MLRQQTNNLLQLILSLTKGEKKHFRLLVTRHQAGEAPLFLKLFDVLDKHKVYDERLILKKLPAIKKQQLSNLKSHLYKQLLSSIRMLNRTHNLDIEVREQLDYARLLYNKGLYLQSLDILDKSKGKAYHLRHLSLILEIIEFEKLIESQYITRSMAPRAKELALESDKISAALQKEHELSNLSLLLYGRYLQTGLARNQEEVDDLVEAFSERLASYQKETLGFYGKLYLFQSQLWYYHILQNFKGCYRYSKAWVELFEATPEMRMNACPLYLKGLHNLLIALFNMGEYHRFVKTLNVLENLMNAKQTYSRHVEGSLCLFWYVHRIGKHFIEGSFSEGVLWVEELVDLIQENPYNWDPHRIMVFYYKIACMYFGSGNMEQTTVYLNLIINHKKQSIREDIQCFTRILNLLAHYEMGNVLLIEYQIKSVYRFLLKMKDLNQVQKRILLFLQKTPNLLLHQVKPAFEKLYQELKTLEQETGEQRAFLYLDLLSWLESKIKNIPVETVIQAKFNTRNLKA